MSQTTRIFCVAWGCLLTIELTGCTAARQLPQPSESAALREAYAIHEPTLKCAQANQRVYQVIERLGFAITSFSPASPGGTGLLKGTREGASGQEPVSVQIRCAADGVYVDANADSPIDVASENALPLSSTHQAAQLAASGAPPARVYFRRAFYALFTGMSEAAAREEPTTPPGQMHVTMKPLIGLATTLEFGTEVTQLFPVRVEIINTTPHTYMLEVDKVVLLTLDGKRVQSLAADSNTFPAPALTNQTLVPGARTKGYLYYPPGSYTGARGVLLEEKSQEREGFEVQF